MHLQNKLGDTGQEAGKGTSNVSEETASRTAAPGSLPHSPEKGQPGNQGAGSLRARALALRCPASAAIRPPDTVGKRQLSPSLQPSPPLWPRSSSHRPSSPLSAPAGRATGRLLPAPPAPAPPATLHPSRRFTPVQAQEASSGAQRRGSSGRRRLLQEAKPLTWLMRLLASPEGSAPCSSFSPIRNSPGRRLRPLLPSRATFGSDAQAKGVELK